MQNKQRFYAPCTLICRTANILLFLYSNNIYCTLWYKERAVNKGELDKIDLGASRIACINTNKPFCIRRCNCKKQKAWNSLFIPEVNSWIYVLTRPDLDNIVFYILQKHECFSVTSVVLYFQCLVLLTL